MKEKNYFCWFVQRVKNTRGATYAQHTRYLCAMLLVLFMGIGQMWGAVIDLTPDAEVKGTNKTWKEVGGGYVSRNGGGFTISTDGLQTGSGNTYVVFDVAAASTIEAKFINTSTTAYPDKTICCGKVSSTQWTAITNAASNGTTQYQLTIESGDKLTDQTISLPGTKSATTSCTFTATAAGKYAVYWTSSINNKVRLYEIEITASGGGDPVCPSGLTISSKDSKTAFYTGDAIELTAALSEGNGAITYQWYKGGKAEGNKLTGKTAAKLEIASCALGDAGDYYCVASKSDCSDAVNADAFTITVTPSPCVTVTGAEQFVADYTINGAYAINSGCATNNGALKIDNGSDFIEIYAPAGKKISLIEMSLYAGADKKVGYGFGASAVVDNDLTPWDWATKDVTASYADYEFEPISSGKAKYFRLYRKVTVDAVEYGSGTSTFINRICVTLENTAAYTITYNLNGGTGTTPTESDKEAGTIVTLASGIDGITAPSGQKFNGWLVKDATDATVAVTDGKFTMPASAVTITAQWADVYAVTYAANGGDGTMTDSNSPYAAGDEVTLLTNTFGAPTGQEFDAWEVTETVSGNPVAVSAGKFTMPSAAVTVKATWKTACALDPTVSATTLGTTSYTTQVVNCAGISVLGSAGCTISEYGFVYGTATAPTISDNKKALEGDYTVAGTAFAETILSGLASNTKYYVRAFATNSHGTAYGEEISFTTLTPLGNVLVVANSADQTSDAITALRNSGFIVTVSTHDHERSYTEYDLVVLDESLGGGDAQTATNEESKIKDVNIPILNLKAFFYTKTNRWNWGSPVNGTGGNEIANIPTTYKNAQSHPIFEGLTITEGAIDLIDPAKTGNTLQGVTTNTLIEGKEGYTLATSGDGITFIHELTPAQRGVTDAKYLMVAISNNAKDNLSADGERLIVNAAKYLVGTTAWEPQYYTVSFEAHGDADPSPLTGKTITLPSAANGTASLLGWFTEATGGEKIGDAGESYTPTADITLHAQWETVSTDARIKALSYTIGGGAPVDIYEADKNTFNISLPYAQAYDAITVAVAPNNDLATIKAGAELTVSSIPGAATFTIVAQSGAEENYTVNFAKGPKDGVCLVWADATGNNAMTVDAEKSLFDATAAASSTKNTSTYGGKTGYKLNSRPANMSVTLSEETFKAGDVVEVFVTSVVDNAGANDKMRVFTENDVTKMLVEGDADMVQGANRLVLPATTTNALYLVRGPQDAAYEMWNPYVAYIAVYRPMNPVLTAITINGETGTINESAKTVAVELQPGYNLAALTIVPTIVSNTAEASVVKTVESNGGAWVIGDNTYRLTDKDGDYTEYTVTLSVGVLKHTVSFNTHGGSAIADVEVEDGQKLTAAPTDPEREDYVFQGWAETEDGAIVDVTTFTISADKEFHAVWAAETGVIKLIGNDGNINTNDFITGVTKTSVTFDEVEHNGAAWSGTQGAISGANQLGKVVQYNATTNQTKLKIKVYNTNNAAKQVYIHKILEGETTAEVETLEVASKTPVESVYYPFNSDENRSFYITTNSKDVKILQVKVVDDGTTTLKRAGQVGYELNLNKGRVLYYADSDVTFEGLALASASNYNVISATEFQTTKNLSFSISAPVTLVVTTNSAKYYVSQNAEENGTTATAVTTAGEEEFNLTATGTWYLVPSTTSNVKYTKIAFEAPKCVVPVIGTQPASKIDYTTGNDMTASVVASVTDGGTLKYQWYDAADNSEVSGATEATLKTTTPGTYYVIITNTKDGYQEASVQSDNATLKYRRADDASLIALTYETEAITLIDGVYNYRVVLPADATDVPALSATATMNAYGATADVTNATEFVNYEAVSSVLVTAEDETTTQTYTVTFVVKHDYAKAEDVTGNTTWNWDGVASAEVKIVASEHGVVLANYISADNFEKLEGQDGARAYRSNTYPSYQGTYLKFHTTVPGRLTINARYASGADLIVNGKKLADLTGTRANYTTIVFTGDVEITSSTGDYRIYNMKFEELTPDYTRPVTEGRYGTICLPYDGLMGCATLYEVAYKDASKIYFDEVLDGSMTAGTPYIFLPNKGAEELQVIYTDNVAAPAGSAKGLVGFIGADEDAAKEVPVGSYILNNNQYRLVEYAGSAFIQSNRAYINLDAISTKASAPAPNRRRISMGYSGAQVATGIGEVQGDEVQSSKLLINGQLFILRGEKMYDASGRLVK